MNLPVMIYESEACTPQPRDVTPLEFRELKGMTPLIPGVRHWPVECNALSCEKQRIGGRVS